MIPHRQFKLLACLALLLLAAACAETQAPAPTAPPPAPTQEVSFRVLDSHDNSLAKARLEVRPLAGAPAGPGPYGPGADGLIRIQWKPQGKDLGLGKNSGDQIFEWRTSFNWKVSAPGFIPDLGTITLSDKTRRIADPRLAKLNSQAAPAPHGIVVVLRRQEEMLGGELAGKSLEQPLAKALVKFREENEVVARRLGCEFAWPAFSLQKGTVTINFDWKGSPWVEGSAAPLAARVAFLAGMPMFMAAGQDLLPLKGVTNLRLNFTSQWQPGGDEHAIPVKARVVLQAPAQEVITLSQGGIKPARFLAAHPPRLVKEP